MVILNELVLLTFACSKPRIICIYKEQLNENSVQPVHIIVADWKETAAFIHTYTYNIPIIYVCTCMYICMCNTFFTASMQNIIRFHTHLPLLSHLLPFLRHKTHLKWFSQWQMPTNFICYTKVVVDRLRHGLSRWMVMAVDGYTWIGRVSSVHWPHTASVLIAQYLSTFSMLLGKRWENLTTSIPISGSSLIFLEYFMREIYIIVLGTFWR